MRCAELEDRLCSMERLSKDLIICRKELEICREAKALQAKRLEEYRLKYEGLLEKYVEALALRQRGGSKETVH